MEAAPLRARSAAARKVAASPFSGSRAKTAWARSHTTRQSSCETAASTSSRSPSLCRLSRSLTKLAGLHDLFLLLASRITGSPL